MLFTIEHHLHRLVCSHCHTATCAELTVGVESCRLSALVGLSGSVHHLSHRKVQGLLDQLLGIEASTGANNSIRCRLSDSLAALVEEAAETIRWEHLALVDQHLLDLKHQLTHQRQRWREGADQLQQLLAFRTPIRQALEAKLRELSDLGFDKGEKTRWASSVRTCRQNLWATPSLSTLLENPEVEPKNNAAERALRPAVIHRKLR